MTLIRREGWTAEQLLGVADLVLDPGSNGGTKSHLTSGEVAASLPTDAPTWGVFDGGRCLFVVGLNPFSWNPEMTRMRGILHVAGTRETPDAYRIVAAFLDALPGVEVMTLTNNPALIRLARRVGLLPLTEQDGYTVLGR